MTLTQITYQKQLITISGVMTELEGAQFKPHQVFCRAQGPNHITRLPVTFELKLNYAMCIQKVCLEILLQIKDSVGEKCPDNFFGALKTGQNEKSYLFLGN